MDPRRTYLPSTNTLVCFKPDRARASKYKLLLHCAK